MPTFTSSLPRFVKKQPYRIAMLLALLLLLLALLSIAYSFYTQYKIKKANYQRQEVEQLSHSKPSYRADDITRAYLFGNPSKIVKPVAKETPTTNLDLVLQGILYATDKNISRALISSSKKKTVLYSIDEKIKHSDVKIKEIRSSEVILDRNGVYESLPLIKKTKSGNRQILTYSQPGHEDDLMPPVDEEYIEPSNHSAVKTRPSPKKKAAKLSLKEKLRRMGEL